MLTLLSSDYVNTLKIHSYIFNIHYYLLWYWVMLTFNRLAPYNLSEKIKMGSKKLKKILNSFKILGGSLSLFIFYIFISSSNSSHYLVL